VAVKKKPVAKKEAPRKPSNTTLQQVKEQLSGVSLSLPGWGILRKVSSVQNAAAAAAMKANPKLVKASRVLVDVEMEEWKDLQAARTGARAWFNYHTFPYCVEGQRLFRKDRRDSIWRHAKEWAEEIKEAADKLTDSREGILEWAQGELGDAFDPNLYPQDFADRFSLIIREHSIEPPSYLMHTNAEEYQRTLERQLRDVESSMRDFEQQCTQSVGESVGRILRAVNTDGKLYSSSLEGIQKVISRIGMMRFEGTAVFQAAMRDAKEAIQGVGIAELRRPGGVRKKTTERLKQLMERYKDLKAAAAAKLQAADANPV
jgi:hypothetical protein